MEKQQHFPVSFTGSHNFQKSKDDSKTEEASGEPLPDGTLTEVYYHCDFTDYDAE